MANNGMQPTQTPWRFGASACFFFAGLFSFYTPILWAANFQVSVTQPSNAACNLSASKLTVDAATGLTVIDVASNFSCSAAAVETLRTQATLTVPGATTVGQGTGTGSVGLTLATGLNQSTPGVTCVPDGVNASSNVQVTSGWDSALCTNCGSSASRTVTVQNTGSTSGTIAFKAACSYQDPTDANIRFQVALVSTPIVTVLAGSGPPPTSCSSVSQLGVPNGLSDSNRLPFGEVRQGLYPGLQVDFLNYTGTYGFASNTYPPGSGDTQGFGFPGNNPTTIKVFLDRGKYISWKFRAPTNSTYNNVAGSFLFQPGGALTLATIAPCPGQFGTDPLFPINGSCSVIAKSSNLNFVYTSQPDTRCKLIPGNTYYLNIIQANQNSLTAPTCSSARCYFLSSLTGGLP